MARRESILERLIDVGNAGTLVLEHQAQRPPAGLLDTFEANRTPAAIDDRVSRELAVRGHHLRDVDERESKLDRPVARRLPNQQYVVIGAYGKNLGISYL